MEPLSVAVLAGGKSRRMGRDKAMLRLGGRTLLEITAHRAARAGDEVFVVASHHQEYARLGFEVVPDVFENAGSLGGIFSAVKHAQNDYCLVVACDMPLLNTELLEFLARIPRKYDALIPVLSADRSDQGGGNTLETLHAIYSRSVLPTFEERIGRGQLKIADALSELQVSHVLEDQIRLIDHDLLSFFNVNTPEDLEYVRARNQHDR